MQLTLLPYSYRCTPTVLSQRLGLSVHGFPSLKKKTKTYACSPQIPWKTTYPLSPPPTSVIRSFKMPVTGEGSLLALLYTAGQKAGHYLRIFQETDFCVI